jgi:hypothetical protein
MRTRWWARSFFTRGGLLLAWLIALLSAACTGSPDRGPGFPGDLGLAAGPRPVYGFVVVGDYGTGDAEEAAVASRIRSWIATRPFDAFVTVGDNVYGEGDPEDFPEAWSAPFGWVAREQIPIVASLGNHDVTSDGGEPVMGLLGMSGRWYERSLGSVDFFVLDANDPANESQLTWLRDALAGSTATWKIAVFHQPAYSCGRHGSTAEVQQSWVGLFQRYDVDLVLNGHDHDYQRFAPMGEVTYVVTGGGGAELYEVDDCPPGTPMPFAYNDDVHHFLYVSVTSTELKGQAVSSEGRVLDSFALFD